MRINMAVLFWIRSVQNGLNLTKLGQIGSKKIKMVNPELPLKKFYKLHNWMFWFKARAGNSALRSPKLSMCLSALLLPAWRIFSRLPTAACQRTFKKETTLQTGSLKSCQIVWFKNSKMVKLTEEMIVARTRVSDMSNVKKLNCW